MFMKQYYILFAILKLNLLLKISSVQCYSNIVRISSDPSSWIVDEMIYFKRLIYFDEHDSICVYNIS